MTWQLPCLPWRRHLISYSHRLRLLKTKPRILSYENLILWMNYNATWIPNLTIYLSLKWKHGLGRNGILMIGWEHGRRPWWNWKHWAPKVSWIIFTSRNSLSNPCLRRNSPQRLSNPALLEESVMKSIKPEEVSLKDTDGASQDPAATTSFCL